MARVWPKQYGHWKGAQICVLLATASAASLSCAVALHAQETALRGTVSESSVDELLLKQRRAADAQSPDTQDKPASYQPVSPGAVPGQAVGADGLFSEPPGAEADFAPAATPVRQSARQRAEETRKRLMSPAGPTATRLRKPIETDDITTAVIRQGTMDSGELARQGPESVRLSAIEGRKPRPDENPFEPVGLRLGSFVLRSSLEQGIVATSNADSSTGGRSAVLSETTLRLNATSDWETHAAAINAYGGFRKTLSGQEVRDLAGGIEGSLELEFANDLRATGGLAYTVSPESATSPVVVAGPDRATLQTIDLGLGLEKDIGNLRLGLAGEATRELYGNADLPSSGTAQKDRNSTLYAGTLRVGYELSPAITPFGEVEFGRRIYDQKYDSAGYQRSANIVGARAGVELDMGEKFAGELSAGWISENFDDASLNTVSAATIAADLRWSPIRGTIVSLNGTTAVEGSTTPGESGSVLYAGRLSVEREMRANLSGLAAVGVGWRDYSGTDDHELGLTAEASLTWWLNRYAGLTGRLRHETFNSTLPGRDSTTDSVFLGVKVQR